MLMYTAELRRSMYVRAHSTSCAAISCDFIYRDPPELAARVCGCRDACTRREMFRFGTVAIVFRPRIAFSSRSVVASTGLRNIYIPCALCLLQEPKSVKQGHVEHLLEVLGLQVWTGP